jgi:hypothetical protein
MEHSTFVLLKQRILFRVYPVLIESDAGNACNS